MDLRIFGGTCWYDYLEIRDGPSKDSPLLKKLCGIGLPASIQSSQNHLWIRWEQIYCTYTSTDNHKFNLIITCISDSNLVDPTLLLRAKQVLMLSTVRCIHSLHVEESSQMKVEYCPHLCTQIHTHDWLTVSTLYLSQMEPMSTSLSLPWTLTAKEHQQIS